MADDVVSSTLVKHHIDMMWGVPAGRISKLGRSFARSRDYDAMGKYTECSGLYSSHKIGIIALRGSSIGEGIKCYHAMSVYNVIQASKATAIVRRLSPSLKTECLLLWHLTCTAL